MAKLEVLQEGDCLCHTNVSVHFEAHVGNRISWIDIPNYILSDDVQAWSLLSAAHVSVYIIEDGTKL